MFKINEFGLDVADAFARSFIYLGTTFTQSPALGMIGAAAFASAKVVSLVTRPLFDKMPYIGDAAHQFTRGFIIRTIFTRNIHSGLVLGATYAVVEAISDLSKKIILQSKILEKTPLKGYVDQIPKEWPSDIFNAFFSELNKPSVNIGLIDGTVHAFSKTIALLFQKIIVDVQPLQKIGLNPYLNGFSDNYGLESAGVFVKGFIAGTILSINPTAGLLNGILALTAFHVHALYAAKSKEFR